MVSAVGSGTGGGRRHLLLGALLAMAVIIGLLNLCTLGAHGAQLHEDPAVASSAPQAVEQAFEHAALDRQHAAPTEQPTHAIVITCAMALLAFVVLLTVPLNERRRSARRLHHKPLRAVRAWVRRSRPSLLVLCISRT